MVDVDPRSQLKCQDKPVQGQARSGKVRKGCDLKCHKSCLFCIFLHKQGISGVWHGDR